MPRRLGFKVFACQVLRFSVSVPGAPLMGFHSPPEIGQIPSRRIRPRRTWHFNGTSLEVSSPTTILCAEQWPHEPSLPHPTRQRLQVFSTSWRLATPHRPALFRARSVHGVHPPELSSSRTAVHRLRRRSPHGVRATRKVSRPNRSKSHRSAPHHKAAIVRPAKHSPPSGFSSMRESANRASAV